MSQTELSLSEQPPIARAPIKLVPPHLVGTEYVQYEEADGYSQLSLRIQKEEDLVRWLRKHKPHRDDLVEVILRTTTDEGEPGDSFLVRGAERDAEHGFEIYNLDASEGQQKPALISKVNNRFWLPIFMQPGGLGVIGGEGTVTEVEVPVTLLTPEQSSRLGGVAITKGGQDPFEAADNLIEQLPERAEATVKPAVTPTEPSQETRPPTVVELAELLNGGNEDITKAMTYVLGISDDNTRRQYAVLLNLPPRLVGLQDRAPELSRFKYWQERLRLGWLAVKNRRR